MDIKNHKDLYIRATSNGVIVSDFPRGRDGQYCAQIELAVFNDPDDMAGWIKAYFLNEPNDDVSNA